MFRSFLAPFQKPFPAVSVAAATASWWLAGGVSQTNAIGVYQAKGAASQAASYVNLANPGTYNAAPGDAPTWDATNGWINENTKWLTTGIVPANGYTYIVRYSDAVTTDAVLFGVLSSNGSAGVYYQPTRNGNTRGHANGENNNNGVVAEQKASGVVAIAGQSAYYNGVNLGVTLSAWNTSLTYQPVYIFRLNYSAHLSLVSKIQAFAIYNITLTAPQVAAISAAMAAL